MRIIQMSTHSSPDTRPPQKNIVSTPQPKGINIKELIKKFKKDDYILAGLIIVLMVEGCDDYILLAALGYLFVMGLL